MLVYVSRNEWQDFVYSTDMLGIASQLGYKVALKNRTIFINDESYITIGDSYTDQELYNQVEQYLLHILKKFGYQIYKLVEI